MAEERLIDDDKDRKYKIIKNENGEDELVIDESAEVEEELPAFDFSMYGEDGDLTPDQIAERERARLEAREAEKAKLEEAMKEAEKKLNDGDFESALYKLTQAEDYAEGNGGYYCLKLKILTRNFTDFTSLEKAAQCSDNVKSFADNEKKAELSSLSEPYKNKLKEIEEATNKLYSENEEKKAERRETFIELKGKATRNLVLAGLPFLVFSILLIMFGTMWNSAENGTYLILTIVFACLAFIMLLLTLFTLRKFLEARRRVIMNEQDKSTKLGREYLSSKTDLEYIQRILSSFENDLS